MIDTAMILAAGRGERMRPLTDDLPKPLLVAGGKALIVWHLENLARSGFKNVVINHAWLGQKIEAALGRGEAWGLNITYSPETEALETAGGIAKALPLLGERPFLVVNGDIFCDFDFARAHSIAQQLSPWGVQNRPQHAWCVMVPNAEHHPQGDFAVGQGRLCSPDVENGLQGLTFSGIAVYDPSFFSGVPKGGKMPLRPLLEAGIRDKSIAAEFFNGRWFDIGTPERLAALDAQIRAERPKQ
jgi:N-acetyl-alpha-D-muramate 1-phosphate uridylyltransferase